MTDKILKLKKEKNAVILTHYYAPEEAQQVADFVGDSFYLAKKAKETGADIILFCGVRFMGESAKILNPEKKVLMPDPSADCPMAHMVAEGKIQQMRKAYSDLSVVCYINSTAELKCLSDVCVTSSNAVKIVKSLKSKNIFFIPDKNLGAFVAKQVPEKNIILNDGFCPIHADLTAAQVLKAREKHPEALILTHPECENEVLSVSDFIGSTAEIIDYAKNSSSAEFIICTERGVEHKLFSDNPDKKFFFPEPCPCCADMKANTAQAILETLEAENNEIILDDEICKKAIIPLNKMLELAR
ncbi:MAG: quinolinate synthase NadA [Clostridia bacterium]|nr:quinolinate synthase NadA [Clostridia bacterium]